MDDVTYEGAALTLTGYNIYRDGKLLATVPAGTTHYTDNKLGEDGHIYHVSALYKEGESGWSNAATVVTGIENVAEQKVRPMYTTSQVYWLSITQQPSKVCLTAFISSEDIRL